MAPELFAVLPNSNGHVGAIVVHRAGEARVIDTAYGAQKIDASGAVSTATLNPTEVRASFGPALEALPGKPASFALYFLEGRWTIAHRQLMDAFAEAEEWREYAGQARFFTLLDGLVSVEELRTGDGRPFGGAMRTFDRTQRSWSDAWVSERSGVLQLPQHGRFVDGVGTIESPDEYEGKPILARGVWRRIGADLVTWEQAFSLDGGKHWTSNWFMRFERVSNSPFDP